MIAKKNKTDTGKWKAVIFDDDGNPIMHTKLYRDHYGAENAVASIKNHGLVFDNYKVSKIGTDYVFRLRSPNNKIIGTSPIFPAHYDAFSAIIRAIDIIKDEQKAA